MVDYLDSDKSDSDSDTAVSEEMLGGERVLVSPSHNINMREKIMQLTPSYYKLFFEDHPPSYKDI